MVGHQQVIAYLIERIGINGGKGILLPVHNALLDSHVHLSQGHHGGGCP